jgi:hypothetical protein
MTALANQPSTPAHATRRWPGRAEAGVGAPAKPYTGGRNSTPGWPGRNAPAPSRPGSSGPRRDLVALYQFADLIGRRHTTDRDGCPDCHRDQLCETHAARAARARQYQHALDQELEATP